MPILVHQPLGGESDQHLVDVATPKRLDEDPFGFLNNLLNRELVVTAFQPGDYKHNSLCRSVARAQRPAKKRVEVLSQPRERKLILVVDPLNETSWTSRHMNCMK